MKRCVSLITQSDKQATILDFFAGSGTTPHAVILLNKDDSGSRKYVVTEMGLHFETVLVERLKKVVYSTDWKEGKPQTSNTGISHAFKIARLESYEDTLNNLHLRRTREQDVALATADEFTRDQYMLGYFLDLESEGSPSLLDTTQFREPFDYQLNIATSSAGETKETTVDFVVHLLKGYADRFYQFHKRDFESPFLEYQRLTKPAGGICLRMDSSL